MQPRIFMARHYKTVACAMTLLGALTTASQAAPPSHSLRPPPDSYLQYQVHSVSQFIAQVQNNPTVRQRFARHFQIPESRIVSYMRSNLVESYIPETRRYTVYCMSPTGRIFAVTQIFHKGTKVFALRNGQPVLKWLCGNPLSRFLPAVVTKTITKPKTKVAGSIENLVTPEENVDVLVPTEAAPVYLPAVPVTLASAPLSVLSSLSGSSFSPLYLLPAALLFSHSGGGGGSGSTPHTPPVVPPHVPSVPEPAGTAYVLMSLPLLALGVARRRRSAGTKRGESAS